MGFFQTVIEGYKLMFRDAKLGWEKHGGQILASSGTGLMMISGALMGRRGTKQEVQQAIADANAVIDNIQKEKVEAISADGQPVTEKVVKKETRKKHIRLAKAKAGKVWKVGKHFWKEAGGMAVGGGLVYLGIRKEESQKAVIAAGAAALAGEFAAYRANVIADGGEEKDLEYLTGKKQMKPVLDKKGKPVKDKQTGEDIYVDEDGVNIPMDPGAFKFWFSPETCPGLYYDNLDLTIKNLEWVEDTLTRIGRTTGWVYLNDMRREFGGLQPHKMDHPLGGIFGKVFDRNKVDGNQKIDLGWRNDRDFVEGRKVGTWIIFPCDKEPIISKVNKKIKPVEIPEM